MSIKPNKINISGITFPTSVNVTYQGPFDARTKVDKKDDLIKSETWLVENPNTLEPTNYLYNGMLVIAEKGYNDKPTLYILIDYNPEEPLTFDNWKQVCMLDDMYNAIVEFTEGDFIGEVKEGWYIENIEQQTEQVGPEDYKHWVINSKYAFDYIASEKWNKIYTYDNDGMSPGSSEGYTPTLAKIYPAIRCIIKNNNNEVVNIVYIDVSNLKHEPYGFIADNQYEHGGNLISVSAGYPGAIRFRGTGAVNIDGQQMNNYNPLIQEKSYGGSINIGLKWRKLSYKPIKLIYIYELTNLININDRMSLPYNNALFGTPTTIDPRWDEYGYFKREVIIYPESLNNNQYEYNITTHIEGVINDYDNICATNGVSLWDLDGHKNPPYNWNCVCNGEDVSRWTYGGQSIVIAFKPGEEYKITITPLLTDTDWPRSTN